MKTTLLLVTILLSVTMEVWPQRATPNPGKLTKPGPCVPSRIAKPTKQPAVQTVAPAPAEPVDDFLVGEAMVEVTKDQTVVKLAMAQHGSVLIELPANDGPRFIIPGDPDMVTVDEKALERNKRAIVVRPGSLFVVPTSNHKKRLPAATVTAQMRSGLVVTFLFYPVTDLAKNVHRCVLSYARDEVVARRRAAGLPVNLDQKEQGSEKAAAQSGAAASISVELTEEAEANGTGRSKNSTVIPGLESTSKPAEIKPVPTPLWNGSAPLASGTTDITERAVATARKQLARVIAESAAFKNWTRPLHGLALSVQQDVDRQEGLRVLLLAVKNAGAQPLQLIPGTPDLTLEMHDDKSKVISVRSIKPLHIEVSDTSREVVAGGSLYYAIAYTPPLMGVRHRLKIVVAQANAVDEPASIALTR